MVDMSGKRPRPASILAMLLIVGSGLLARASGTPERATITRGQIVNALVTNGIHVSEGQVYPLAEITASGPGAPRLEVVSVRPQNGNTANVRLKCANTRLCLPFYVLIHWQDPDQVKDALLSGHLRTLSSAETLSREEMLVKSGRTATLVLERENSRITMPVLCLQSGARGQSVRVRSKDSNKVYLATVIASGLVTSASEN